MGRAKAKYTPDLPRKMYSYFTGYTGSGAPSFTAFAVAMGMTLADLNRLRSHRELDRSYAECNEIRRDYLINMALSKRNDPTFTRYLLGAEYRMGEDDEQEDRRLEVTVEVIEE